MDEKPLCVYEMDRQTNHQKMEMPLKLIKFYKIFFTRTRMTLDLFQ